MVRVVDFPSLIGVGASGSIYGAGIRSLPPTPLLVCFWWVCFPPHPAEQRAAEFP